uniref:Large subunit ribosomal protein L27e n=1 Tax=Tetraselmis sp. GSL018 TaxID=582737 RepID=A0A061RGW1_9CHLO
MAANSSSLAGCSDSSYHQPHLHAMVKFLKPNKVVILLAGRYAGKKAVIVKNFDDGTNTRKYGHALVCGLSKEPRKVIKKQSKKKQARRSSLKTFVKLVNYNHIMPTRYSLDVDLKAVVTPDVAENSTKRTEARKEAKKLMEDKFKTGKHRWFFTKLRF